MRRINLQTDVKETALSILGGMIYAVSFSIFVSQAGLFIGNITGFAQMLQALFEKLIPGLPDFTGVLLWILNLPLFLLSYRVINRKFFWRSLITTTAQALTIYLMPKVVIADMDSLLTLVLIGSVLAGYGVGLSLRNGGSGGGLDIIGVYMSLKHKGLSVGRVSLVISSIVYLYAVTQHSAKVMIYSLIFTVMYSIVIDYTHYQNVKTSVLIATKNSDVLRLITEKLQRGATYWDAKGAHSHKPVMVISSTVSKYELIRLRRLIRELDPEAFVIENENVGVTGNFETHFF
jgi:uncharacterized membrane-anchored protein YitT (DUF2179 family)